MIKESVTTMIKNRLLFRLAAKRQKASFFFLIFFSGLVLLPLPVSAQQGTNTSNLPAHELGDQMLGINVGLIFPLFFQDFYGDFLATNLSVGGLGQLEWATYIYPFFRVGAEIGGSFNISPQIHSLLMLPILVKATYLFSIARFEFPIFLGVGINIVRYRDWSQPDFAIHPGIGGYWRYDANWSFGLQASWWWELQIATQFQPSSQALIGHFLQITPAVLYHF